MMRLSGQGLYSLSDPWLLTAIMAITLIHWGINVLGLYFAVISFSPDNPLPFLAAFFLLPFIALGILPLRSW